MTRQCMYLLAYCVFFYSTLRPVLQWSTTVNETIVRTNTRDSISRVSRMTRAVERSFCVGAVGISMAVVKSDRTLRDILEREIIIFSTVLDCLGPINRLASHVFFLAPKGWLRNCKPWSIQTFLNMKRVKEKMRRDFLHRQKNLFLTQQVMLIFLTLKVKLHFHVTWVHVASRLPQLSLFSKISLDKKRINLHTDKQRLGRNGTPVLQNYRFTAITDLTDWRHDWIVFQFLWKM